MLRWALRYLVVATAVAGVFAMLQGRDWARPEARQVSGERPHQRAANRQVDHDDGESGDLEQIIHAGPQGHFMVDAVVNGEPVEFMVDTGASHVVLTLEDARKLGFSASNLDFTHRFESANGVVQAAPVALREFRIRAC